MSFPQSRPVLTYPEKVDSELGNLAVVITMVKWGKQSYTTWPLPVLTKSNKGDHIVFGLSSQLRDEAFKNYASCRL